MAASITLAACSAPGAGDPSGSSSTAAMTPVAPTTPITLNILDGGALSVIQPAIDKWVAEHPEWVKEVNYQSAASTDVAGKIKAQQDAGAVDISLVLGGVSVLGSQGTSQYVQQLPALASSLPDLSAIQDDSMAELQASADGCGVLIHFEKSGPILAFNPDVVSAADIDTPEKLLSWAQAHPGRFTYAQPPNSGPGFQFLQSLPYMLGDTDPSDPENGWDKTWAYLAELGKTIKTYPASSTLMNQQFGTGEYDVVTSIIGQEILNRQSGTWPADTGATAYENPEWMTDGHFAWIPKGGTPQMLFVALQLETMILSVEAQTTDNNIAVHASANKNAYTGSYSPEITEFVAKWGRPDYWPVVQATGNAHMQLPPTVLKKAFDLWQRKIGSTVGG